LQPVGGAGKSVYVMLVCLALSLIGAIAARSYSKGGTAYISCNAPGAQVSVDGGYRGIAGASGSVELRSLPYGKRALQIQQRDYELLSTTIGMGWLSGNRFSLQLKPLPLTLTVFTAAGADVQLNGQSVGTANQQGVFAKNDVLPGDYDIQVTLSGYTPFHAHRHLSPKFERLYAGLTVNQVRTRPTPAEPRRRGRSSGR
jgi:hypothetical protein